MQTSVNMLTPAGPIKHHWSVSLALIGLLFAWSPLWTQRLDALLQVHTTVKLLKAYHQRVRDLANRRKSALVRCHSAPQ